MSLAVNGWDLTGARSRAHNASSSDMRKKTSSSDKSSSGKRQHQIRMDDGLKDRIRKYQQRVERDTGLEVSFSSAVRSLIEKGLEAAQ